MESQLQQGVHPTTEGIWQDDSPWRCFAGQSILPAPSIIFLGPSSRFWCVPGNHPSEGVSNKQSCSQHTHTHLLTLGTNQLPQTICHDHTMHHGPPSTQVVHWVFIVIQAHGDNVERHDGGEKARCIDGINTTIYYYENSHSHMIWSHDWLTHQLQQIILQRTCLSLVKLEQSMVFEKWYKPKPYAQSWLS